MEVQELLKKEAISLGLCQQWQDEWGTPDVDTLCDKFIRGIDFCIKHDFPKIEKINELFKKEDLERNGIYTQGLSHVKNKKHVIAMGDAEVVVTVPENCICDIYARHNAKVRVEASQNSFTYFSLYDSGKVIIDNKSEGAKIKCSLFSGEIVNKDLVDTIHYK